MKLLGLFILEKNNEKLFYIFRKFNLIYKLKFNSLLMLILKSTKFILFLFISRSSALYQMFLDSHVILII